MADSMSPWIALGDVVGSYLRRDAMVTNRAGYSECSVAAPVPARRAPRPGTRAPRPSRAPRRAACAGALRGAAHLLTAAPLEMRNLPKFHLMSLPPMRERSVLLPACAPGHRHSARSAPGGRTAPGAEQQRETGQAGAGTRLLLELRKEGVGVVAVHIHL